VAGTVGIVAVQGDFEKHTQAFQRLGAHVRLVKTPEQLEHVERAVIPGGESTTVGKLMHKFGLGQALIERVNAGMPLWGTCMGMILMAREVEGHDQYRLGVLDVTVRRNAFGAQVHSFEDSVTVQGLEAPVTGVFIRAPIVVRTGPEVVALARYADNVVAVRQGALLATSFHPELTDDTRLHEWFLKF
jgi:5'-phosphate synthase pdxT subunit